jgi:hypothetical protein
MWRWSLHAVIVIPAQAGIHKRQRLKEGDQRRASVCTVSGYGSRALLRSPGMTVLDWSYDPGSSLRFVRDDAGGWVVTEPAPAGPQPLGCEPRLRSRVARLAARLDV